MKQVQAFYETRNDKTAIVVLFDIAGGYFVVKIDHKKGDAESKHSVDFEMKLSRAFENARLFLEVT